MSDALPVWPKTVALALTGASGTQYGLRLLECLIQAGVRVYLMVSQAGQIVLKMEAGVTVPSNPTDMERFFAERYAAAPGQLRVFGRQEWTAPVASGTNPPDAMVVCPCTTGTLASSLQLVRLCTARPLNSFSRRSSRHCTVSSSSDLPKRRGRKNTTREPSSASSAAHRDLSTMA